MIVRTDEPIIIHRRTESGTDSYGNATYTVQQILIRNGLFAFDSSGSEPVEIAGDPLKASLTLYLPPKTVVQDGDQFEIRETMWVKDGSQNEWQQLWPGFTPGVIVKVRQVRG
jgi:hypothetical protein